jgi:hypothetical protein
MSSALARATNKQKQPDFLKLWPQIDVLPAPERNFITAVFVAWTYERNFYDALKSGLLPSEIHLWQGSGDDDGHYYYTYDWDAATYRKIALEERLEHCNREASDFAGQLARFNELSAVALTA